jgi:hypothetical protein
MSAVDEVGGAVPGGLELVDLLNDVETLARLLEQELDRRHVLDSFLLAAGMNQVAEDHLHRRAGLRSTRGVRRWQQRLARLVDVLAEAVLSGGDAAHADVGLLSGVHGLPDGLRRSILRLPDCFRSFDQHPADCATLAERFAQRWPERAKPLLVLGVRTSGSYLAPLVGAALRGLGFREVAVMTTRPGQRWFNHESRLATTMANAGGMALLVDDPPVTGSKLRASAEQVAALGFDNHRVVLLLALLGAAAAVPASLRGLPAVLLPWHDWSVTARLHPDAVGRALDTLLHDPQPVDAVERLSLDPVPDLVARPLVRSHLRALYRVHWHDRWCDVYVKGTGLGYLGRHSLALSRRLQGRIPDVMGWQDGLLYRRALPESRRCTTTVAGASLAADIVDYVVQRRCALALAEDTSLRMQGRRPAWELASAILGNELGRLRRPLQRPLRHLVRNLLTVERPMVIDGSMALSHWFVLDGEAPQQGKVKVDYDERAFSVWDSACCDPVFDLAGAAADAECRSAAAADASDVDNPWSTLAAQLREEGESRLAPIDDERWLLYRMLHLHSRIWHLRRLQAQGPGQLQSSDGSPPPTPHVEVDGFPAMIDTNLEAARRALSRVRTEYLAGLFLTDPVAARAVVAVDLDTAVEANGAATVAGMVAMRSLLRHGYRPLLLTALPPAEARHRCRIYSAAGTIAASQAVAENRIRSSRDVTVLLGHAPGGCAICREPVLRPEATLLLLAFRAGEERRWRRVGPAAALLYRAATS